VTKQALPKPTFFFLEGESQSLGGWIFDAMAWGRNGAVLRVGNPNHSQSSAAVG